VGTGDHACMHAQALVCACVLTLMCMHFCACACVHMHVYACACEYLSAHVHTLTCVHVCVRVYVCKMPFLSVCVGIQSVCMCDPGVEAAETPGRLGHDTGADVSRAREEGAVRYMEHGARAADADAGAGVLCLRRLRLLEPREHLPHWRCMWGGRLHNASAPAQPVLCAEGEGAAPCQHACTCPTDPL